MTPTKLTYLRQPKEISRVYKAKSLISEFRSFLKKDQPKTEEEYNTRIKNLQDRISFLLEN
jgi:hypothetical protein